MHFFYSFFLASGFFVLVSLNSIASGIPYFEMNFNIPVEVNGEEKQMAWVGGLNNPQFSAADLNNNGIEDLVIFDKIGNKVLTFLNQGIPDSIAYVYAPEYAYNFPDDLMHWMLMKDMSCNGIPDIVTSQVASIKVLRGYYDQNDMLAFEEWGFMQFINDQGGLSNIFVTQIDIPGFADINGDGDIDVLAFNQLGGYIYYYENLANELGMCGDTLLFELRDDCWGNIFESEFADSAQFLDTCGVLIPSPAKGFRHPGSTLLPFDENNNGVKDLLLGDILFPKLNRLINGGSPDSAKFVTQDAFFPSYDTSILLPNFPAGFLADINNNGKKDLLVAPNAVQISENIECSWLYENVSANDTMQFSLKAKGFLVEDMIDVGEGSVPVFFDYNGNGVKDLIIANYGRFIETGNMRSEFTLFENRGTNAYPDFMLKEEDYANVSLLAFNQLHPAFGDLTGNGVEDMIVGDRFGNLHFYENTAQSGNPANFVLTSPNFLNIGGSYAAPLLYDLNGNGKLDLIVGERNGNVKFYANSGTDSQFNFSNPATNNFLGQMDARIPGVFTGFAVPAIMEYDGGEYVLLGTSHGKIKAYKVDRTKLSQGTWQLLSEDFSGINIGSRATPAILQAGEDYHLIVGNYRGGLNYFASTDSLILNTANDNLNIQQHRVEVKVFPNPAGEVLQIAVESEMFYDLIELRIFDLSGKELLVKEFPNNSLYNLNLTNFKAGMYVLELKTSTFVRTTKFVRF